MHLYDVMRNNLVRIYNYVHKYAGSFILFVMLYTYILRILWKGVCVYVIVHRTHYVSHEIVHVLYTVCYAQVKSVRDNT